MNRLGCYAAAMGFLLVTLATMFSQSAGAQEAKLTPKTLQVALAANPTGADSERLAGEARLMFGRNLTRGVLKKQDGITLAFGIETAGVTANNGLKVSFSDGHPDLPLQRIGETVVYAAVITMPDLATGHWKMLQGGETKAEGDYELYSVDPASIPNPDTPHGKLTKQSSFRSSTYPANRARLVDLCTGSVQAGAARLRYDCTGRRGIYRIRTHGSR